MASFKQRRCAHCAARYSYQASGYGCHDDLNDARYCPACMKVIVRALESVLPRSKRAWRVTRDVSVETLVELERKNLDAARAEGQLPVRRVLAPLFDMADPSNSHEQGIVSLDGRTYRYEYWSKEGMAAGRVYVEVEEDAATGEVLGPWSLSDRWTATPSFCDLEPEPPREVPARKIEHRPLTTIPTRRFGIIENESLAGLKPAVPRREYERVGVDEIGRRLFNVEALPDGALPIYDKDPDVTGLISGDEGSDEDE